MPSQHKKKKLKVFFIFTDVANSQISLNPEEKERKHKSEQALTISCFFCYYSPCISVYSVKPTPLKVYPYLLMDFFVFKFELRSR